MRAVSVPDLYRSLLPCSGFIPELAAVFRIHTEACCRVVKRFIVCCVNFLDLRHKTVT